MVVVNVTPVGVVGDMAGPELLGSGELWFLLDTDWYWRWLLFDGVGVVRGCWWYGCDGDGDISNVMKCSVEELEVLMVAVEKFLEDVGIGG